MLGSIPDENNVSVPHFDAGPAVTAAVTRPAGHPVRGRLDALAADPFPAAGYNTWATYAEEDAAQALDQFLNIQLGRNTRGDPVTSWTAADGGMHVLALLLYDGLRHGGYDPAAGSYKEEPCFMIVARNGHIQAQTGHDHDGRQNCLNVRVRRNRA